MVLCWQISDTLTDPKDENHRERKEYFDIDCLRRFGVVHFFVNYI